MLYVLFELLCSLSMDYRGGERVPVCYCSGEEGVGIVIGGCLDPAVLHVVASGASGDWDEECLDGDSY